MPYKRISQLPKPVQHVLPVAAQKIWMKAFNSSDEKYKNEVRAIRIAWAAVKKVYEKNDKGRWVRK